MRASDRPEPVPPEITPPDPAPPPDRPVEIPSPQELPPANPPDPPSVLLLSALRPTVSLRNHPRRPPLPSAHAAPWRATGGKPTMEPYA